MNNIPVNICSLLAHIYVMVKETFAKCRTNRKHMTICKVNQKSTFS